jgi:hypothetical protein
VGINFFADFFYFTGIGDQLFPYSIIDQLGGLELLLGFGKLLVEGLLGGV